MVHILVLFGILSLLQIGTALEFGYVPPIGPTNWSTLNSAWAICGSGVRQSPISIPTASAVNWPQLNLTILNGGSQLNGTLRNDAHSIQYRIDSMEENSPVLVASYQRPNNFIDGSYVLQQFHFHWGSIDSQGSENQFNGVSSAAGVHFVARNLNFTNAEAGNRENGFLVLGFLLRVCDWSNFDIVFGMNNEYLSQIRTSSDQVSNIVLRLDDIYGCSGECTDTNTYYSFQGSFTTPPCSEAVTWWVAKDMLCIHQAQLDALRMQNVSSTGPLLTDNFRPVQNLNQRTILTNGNTVSSLHLILLIDTLYIHIFHLR